MPSINDIRVELQCVQDLSKGGPIEEFAPRCLDAMDHKHTFMPDLYEPATQTCSVFIPIFPRAQFFLKYDTKAPIVGVGSPSITKVNKEEMCYVFQLFIGNDEITTWSCGESQNWQGKTSFAMYDTSFPDIHTDGKALEKRIFLFNGDTRVSGDMSWDKDEDRKIELRVFRADKAMRVPKGVMPYEGQGMTQDVRTSLGGIPLASQPKKYFIFGLVDPVDHPHAVFRWFYRTWEEIHRLRLILGTLDDEKSVAVMCSDVQVTKDDVRGIISVRDDSRSHEGAAKRMILSSVRPISTPSSTIARPAASNNQASETAPSVQRGKITMKSNTLRYDKATGKIVPIERVPPIEAVDTRRFSSDVAITTQEAILKQLSHGKNARGTKSGHPQCGAVRLPATMFLPPQHPHAQSSPRTVLGHSAANEAALSSKSGPLNQIKPHIGRQVFPIQDANTVEADKKQAWRHI